MVEHEFQRAGRKRGSERKSKRRICQIAWRVGGRKDHLASWTPVTKVSRDKERDEISAEIVRAGQPQRLCSPVGSRGGGEGGQVRALAGLQRRWGPIAFHQS